ncbi:MAG: UvrB/UvrC motif-containing protein [Patescibacteria group bacterium]|jgi:excinuclease ABC subunit C
MRLPDTLKLKETDIPETPGVYYMKDAAGKILYVGKAVSLARRIPQYWQRPHGEHIEKMVPSIAEIDWQVVPTAIEALILEANEIRKLKPPYNVIGKDDSSFLHVAITNEPYPKPVLIRGYELEATPKKKFKYVFGPYTSSTSIRAALELTRKLFHWSDCQPNQKRPCFYYHIKLCPGVCVGKISRRDYAKIIRRLVLFFDGKKTQILKETERQMKSAAKAENFEEAARLRNLSFALTHIQDISVLKREEDPREARELGINIFGRIEAYDISNIMGQQAVASGVVFVEGLPRKSLYKKFKIKTVEGANDIAMMKEVLRRRFAHASPGDKNEEWKLPDLLVIDGGRGQVNAAMEILMRLGLRIPTIGLAKGPDRKQDVVVYGERTPELVRVVTRYKKILQHARDEAHRFAVSYHRKRRAEKFLGRS